MIFEYDLSLKPQIYKIWLCCMIFLTMHVILQTNNLNVKHQAPLKRLEWKCVF